MEKKVNVNVTYEVCPHCDNEVELPDTLGVYRCPECGKYIVNCTMCLALYEDNENDYCSHCPLVYLANTYNKEEYCKLADEYKDFIEKTFSTSRIPFDKCNSVERPIVEESEVIGVEYRESDNCIIVTLCDIDSNDTTYIYNKMCDFMSIKVLANILATAKSIDWGKVSAKPQIYDATISYTVKLPLVIMAKNEKEAREKALDTFMKNKVANDIANVVDVQVSPSVLNK